MSQISSEQAQLLNSTDRFEVRHIGPTQADVERMLAVTGHTSLDELIAQTIPAAILRNKPLALPAAASEQQMLAEAAALASQNTIARSYIGMGYHHVVTPPVILRNILENPAWYTQYTPYQAEISQGRLEALLNFQTMICDLTGMPIANASLLDEGTAAAEAMSMCYGLLRGKRNTILVSEHCHPQTIDVIRTRATPLDINVVVTDTASMVIDESVFAVLVQYPATHGIIDASLPALSERVHQHKAKIIVAADLLALTLLTPPGEWGADVVIGTTQRFGVPMGYGGPHAAYFATTEGNQRKMPGRLVGVTRDVNDGYALRLALQTREQHIRRDKATSNICTSQVLLAVIASMYAVYHGPEGLRRIAMRVRLLTEVTAAMLSEAGFSLMPGTRFDTVAFEANGEVRVAILARLDAAEIEVRQLDDTYLSVTLDDAVTRAELAALLHALIGQDVSAKIEHTASSVSIDYSDTLARSTAYLEHPTFSSYHSEHELLRYMYRLQQRDLSLTSSMIPLGSCTMKLNATAEMLPVTLPGFGGLHPFTQAKYATGYQAMITELEEMLAEITGLPGVSLQPNAGSQGEYAGLLAIEAYHRSRGDVHRNICLIPSSAHGTNPASAVMAGMKVVVVACDALGNVDVDDLRAKATQHAEHLSALMVTYPSTHGVFEAQIVEICEVVHAHGGQVYMDGANMNAQVALCRPGDFGVDVCHLNLHKTFCIPHGGGGPGVGPIAVAEHLRLFLPNHKLIAMGGEQAIGPVSAAPWGSAGILPISWMYIRMMGADGLKRATEVAILNANYLAKRLGDHYKLLYTGKNGTVAHEFILDIRPLTESAGTTVADIAKRLMDYGFHAPTMSWPVAGTLMVEPTESESLDELDRFADALIAIRAEVAKIENETWTREDNPLKHAPHTAEVLSATEWTRAYSREEAVFPAPWVKATKFWPTVARVDDAFGDRNLICSCPPIEAYVEE